jgi:AraC family transcriptional regulator
MASELPLYIPGQPLLSSEHTFWRGFLVRRYSAPSGEASVPGLQEYWAVIHRSETSNVAVKVAGKWQQARAHPGDITIVPKQAPSEWNLEKPVEALQIYIQPAILTQIMEQVVDLDASRLEIIDRLAIQDPLIQQIGVALLTELHSNAPLGHLYAETLIQTLAMHLVRHHSTLWLPSRPMGGGLPFQKLNRILDYINDHLDREVSLAELATTIDLSSYHFTRLFKQSMGIAPHQYLIERRIDAAKRLLATTHLSIADIAYQVGFSSQSHLTTLFRKRVGMTPAAYRNAL